MVAAIAALALTGAVVLLVLGVEPVPTWFYIFAWYPTIVLLDSFARRRLGGALILADGRRSLSMFAWSVPIWLLFEAANFRLDNWYYVFLPRNGIERWAGITLAFATVVPAVLLAERSLKAAGVGPGWKFAPVVLRPADLSWSVVFGLGQLALALAWPRTFFPLVWGGMWLICEPYVYRTTPELSLFGDIERGEWGRPLRVVIGGLGIGLLWEGFNFWARGKWIYTVPWLEGTKWFEMPPFGFVGFGFFALEAWAMYHALCAAGVAIPAEGGRRAGPGRLLPTVVVVLALSLAVMTGMERWTISSVVPRLTDLPAMPPGLADSLRAAGTATPFALAYASADRLEQAGVSPKETATLLGIARLVTLKGIGAQHAAELVAREITNPCALSNEDPGRLWTALHSSGEGSRRPTPAEVRVWVSGAAQQCRDAR